MTSDRLLPLRIMLDMKGKENIGVAFKAEGKEAGKHYYKKENDNAEIQAVFQLEVQDESWLWNFGFGNLNFGVIKILHTKNIVEGFPLIDILESRDDFKEPYLFKSV